MNLQGVRLGGYELLTELGTGRDSRVYSARDTATEARAAVKVVSLADDAVPRLQREFQILTRVAGPGVVTVWDYGASTANRLAYLAMKAEGPTLADLLLEAPGGRLPLRTVLALALAAAEALAELHGRGWSHGDVKPGNVLYTAAGAALLT